MNLKSQVEKMDAMVARGDILNAIKVFFAEDAATSDYGDTTTIGKAALVAKMESFLEDIAVVNGITLHRTIVGDGVSASEFTFDFDMKDGSNIYWHEIIRRVWNSDGLVVYEKYFSAV